MKQEQTHRNLDELFALARQQESLLSPDEVNNVITSNASTRAYPGNKLVVFIQKQLKWIIMTTITFIGITAILMLSDSPNETGKITELNKKPITENYNKTLEKNILFAKNDSRIVVKEPASEIVTDSSTFFNTLIQNEVNTTTPNYQVFNGDDYVLELSKEELQAIGVFVTDSSIQYYKIDPSGEIYFSFRMENYWKSDYSGLPIPSLDDRIPYGASHPIFTSEYPLARYSTETIKKVSILQLTEAAKSSFEDSKFICRASDNLLSTTFFHIYDSVVKYKKNKLFLAMIEDGFDKTKYFNTANPSEIDNDTLVPILIRNKKYSIIYWFSATEEFVKALPEKYISKYESLYKSVKSIKQNNPDADVINYKSSFYLIAN
jgi:hypothetical protein